MASPDDYQRASGYRRSTSAGVVTTHSPSIGHDSGPSMVDRTGPIQAWQSMEVDSPLLVEFMRGGGATASGATVTELTALRNSTYFRGENLISSAIGMLPTFLMRRTIGPDGRERIEKATDHPLYRLLKKRPNGYQTAFEFKSYMQQLALRDGNAYGLIVPDYRGRAAQIIPLPRHSCTPKLSDDWVLTFEYRRPSGGKAILAANQVFHFRHPMTRDGLTGLSLRDISRETLGTASQAERAAGKMLKGGVMAGGALESDEELGPEAIASLRESMRERSMDGDAAGEWLVLEGGLKAKPFITSAKDAQYEELRKRTVEDIARFMDVPRPLLMMDETSWGTGIEQLGLYFVTYCLMKWFVAWEQAIERSCFTQGEQDADELYVKFNEGALLRGSLKEQAEFFKAALGPNQAYRSVNEARAAFDLNPKTGDETGPDAIPQPATSTPQAAPKEPTDG
jgi:HK97 family phage portal protein